MLLKLAKERNMNVQAITLNIVDNMNRRSGSLDTTSSTSFMRPSTTINQSKLANETVLAIKSTATTVSQQLNDEDHAKINAIDWIVYDSTQRLKLLEYANLSMRWFMLERQNFEATKIVYSKIPNDTLATILAEYNFNHQMTINFDANLQNFIENLPKNVANIIKEYLCFKEYIVNNNNNKKLHFYSRYFNLA
jgi:hypothetical protein